MTISPRGVVGSTSCLVLLWGLRGRHANTRKPRDAASVTVNCDISVADHPIPIYSVFDSRTGFSGSVDRIALFPVSPNSISMREKQCARSN